MKADKMSQSEETYIEQATVIRYTRIERERGEEAKQRHTVREKRAYNHCDQMARLSFNVGHLQ